MKKNFFLILISTFTPIYTQEKIDEKVILIADLPKVVQKQVHQTLSEVHSPSYAVKPLPDEERWDTVSQMFAGFFPHTEKFSNEQQEASKQEYLARHFQPHNELSTLFGWVYLSSAKNNPSINKRNNTTLIASLAKDPNLLRNLDHHLDTVRKSESALLSFWQEGTYPEKSRVTHLYGKKGQPHFYRNYSPLWQEFFTDMRHLKFPLLNIGAFLGTIGILHGANVILGNPLSPRTLERIDLGAGSSIASHVILATYFAEKEFCSLLNYLHEKTNSIAIIIHTLDIASQNLKKHPALADLEYAPILYRLRNSKDGLSPKMNNLLTLLRTNTFRNDPSIFSFKGRVRASYALIQEVKDELVPFFMALGELDAYVAYAKTYNRESNAF